MLHGDDIGTIFSYSLLATSKKAPPVGLSRQLLFGIRAKITAVDIEK